MAFEKLRKQAPSIETVELVLRALEGDPVLIVRHLQSNRAFVDDALARAGVSALGGKKQVTSRDVDEARRENRDVVAKYAVVDLRGFFDDDGRPAERADVPAVIDALPDDVFDSVMRFVSNPDNFRARAVLASADAIAKK